MATTKPDSTDAKASDSTGATASGSIVDDAPDSPTDLPRKSWLKVFKGAAKEFSDDQLGDTAAALTYYAIQAIFPAALALVSILGLLSDDTVSKLIDNLGEVVPGTVTGVISNVVDDLQKSSSGTAGTAFVVGIVLAIWSASGYVAAFMRASNTVYDIPEGRPIWKTLFVRVVTTLVGLVMIILAVVIVVFSGPVAEQAGQFLGLGDTALTVWSIIKWPVLVLIMMLMVAVLYWAAPNAKQSFRWVSPGGVVGILLWLLASALFAFYVSNFSNYGKTYGTFAGVIIFLVWLWISNLSILLGAEIDAELARNRAELAGLPEGAEPYVEPRDTKAMDDDERAEVEGSRRHLEPALGGDAGSAGSADEKSGDQKSADRESGRREPNG